MNLYDMLSPIGRPVMGEVFGIEVEAERLCRIEFDRLMAGLLPEDAFLKEARDSGLWLLKRDGSLRHNGVEFVSPHPLPFDETMNACELLRPIFDNGIVRSSVRAGVHVHCNFSDRGPHELSRFLYNYIMLEPLLFQIVGVEREQNIYCIPSYTADNEVYRWRGLLRALRRGEWHQARAEVSRTCKYSALYLGPLTSFGSVEFRHAPTWSNMDMLRYWIEVVAEVASQEQWDTVETWFPRNDDVPIDWDKYWQDVEELCLRERANLLLPYTYKVSKWGSPAGLMFAASPRPSPVLSRRTTADLIQRLREEAGLAEDEPEPEYGEYEEEEEIE